MRVSEFIEQCDSATGPDQVFEVYRAAMAQFGYDRVALVPVTPPARQALGVASATPAVGIGANIPASWVQHYLSSGYDTCDPVLLQTPRRAEPLLWDRIAKSEALSRKQRRVMTESREAGLLDGVSIPLHGPLGETYVISLARDGRHTRESSLAQPGSLAGMIDLAKLRLLSFQFLLAYSRALGARSGEPAALHLTDRERECLTWIARGKSAWAAATILGVSPHTVNFHLKRCMAKLGVTNRVQAVVAAVRLGLILP